MSAEAILDAALLLVALPSRLVLLDDYARDLDDTPSVRACKALAVRMARRGDEGSLPAGAAARSGLCRAVCGGVRWRA